MLHKEKGESEMRLNMKRNYIKEKGITLIALVVTIVVLLILAGVSINALFGDSGIIKKAQDSQNKMNAAEQNDLEAINELNQWIDNQVNGTTGEDENPTTRPKISTLLGTVVDKNTKAEDAYGNKITIPKGFKIIEHGTEAGSATYTYSGDTIPAVQDGIVIEDTQTGTAGNQFVWVPVGTINNKSGNTTTITLGRYSDFTMTNGAVASGQPVQVASVENCTKAVTISEYYQELSVSREGNDERGSTGQNATARNLKEFISTTLANGGYYIARFEASGKVAQIESKYNQSVLGGIDQPKAAKASRLMYGDRVEYASDLVNSYVWDTTIVFIQTYSGIPNYASQNKGGATLENTGISSDKYCNIWDISGNAGEWTTEYSTKFTDTEYDPCVYRGGGANVFGEEAMYVASERSYMDCYSYSGTAGVIPAMEMSFRPILYIK